MNTARNVVLVYVDMRGFARRALIRKTGVEFAKARAQQSRAKRQQEEGLVETSGQVPVSEKS